MKIYAMEYPNVDVLNFNYILIKFDKTKDATAFKEKFEKHIKAYNRELSTNIKIKRFPENKRDQPILRIEGLGTLAATNFDQFTAILTLSQQFSQSESAPASTGEVVTGADLMQSHIETRGNMSDPNDWLAKYFKGKKNLVIKKKLIEEMQAQTQFSDLKVEQFIDEWWAKHKDQYGSYDPDLGAFLITQQ